MKSVTWSDELRSFPYCSELRGVASGRQQIVLVQVKASNTDTASTKRLSMSDMIILAHGIPPICLSLQKRKKTCRIEAGKCTPRSTQ